MKWIWNAATKRILIVLITYTIHACAPLKSHWSQSLGKRSLLRWHSLELTLNLLQSVYHHKLVCDTKNQMHTPHSARRDKSTAIWCEWNAQMQPCDSSSTNFYDLHHDRPNSTYCNKHGLPLFCIILPFHTPIKANCCGASSAANAHRGAGCSPVNDGYTNHKLVCVKGRRSKEIETQGGVWWRKNKNCIVVMKIK